MLNFWKVVCVLSICWTLSDAFLFDDLLNNSEENDELCKLNLPGIAAYYGYQSETRNVTTEDGYILTVHVIYNATAFNKTLKPCVLFHGLMSNSAGFVLNDPDQCLPFLLADRGYQVFLPNARGNGDSQGYVNASRNSNNLKDPFWRFSWDQIAQYDVPAIIDGVLEWTNQSQVTWIGHSQGTTTMFALLSTNESYNRKISIFIALAPVAYFRHAQSPLYVGAALLIPALNALYGSKFSSASAPQTLLQKTICTPHPTEKVCENLLFLAFGYSNNTNSDRIPVYLCHSPAGFSWGQFTQYAQLKTVDEFQKYDLGEIALITGTTNSAEYGQDKPPAYNVSKISAPVALFHSSADLTTNDIDVATLSSKLPNKVYEQHLDASKKFNHLDYIWAKNAREMVYNYVFPLM